LDRDGFRSKVRTTGKGVISGGESFGRGALFHLLRNPTYVGRIPHKEITYPGLHEAIIDTAVFEAVQQRLAENAVARTQRSTRPTQAPLRGLIFDASGAPMSPSFTYAKCKRIYRYYVSNGPARPGVQQQEAVRRIAAEPVEVIVRERVGQILGAVAAPSWADLSQHLVRIDVLSSAIRITVSDIDGEHDQLSARLSRADVLTPSDEADGHWVIEVAVRPVFRGGRTWMVAPSGSSVDTPIRLDRALVKALRFAHGWQTKLDASPLTSIEGLKAAKSAADYYVRRLTPLAFLAPDIQRAIIEGAQPAGLNLQQLINMKIPVAWEDQRLALGFPSISGPCSPD
jgi:site-specific DNA recombinase